MPTRKGKSKCPASVLSDCIRNNLFFPSYGLYKIQVLLTDGAGKRLRDAKEGMWITFTEAGFTSTIPAFKL